jgi:holo-[acyl-carrier protein] synthase
VTADGRRPGLSEAQVAEQAVHRLLDPASADPARIATARPGSVVGVGVDAVDLDRLGRVLGRRANMATRLFTPAELAYARSAVDPVPRLSTRFAAKEATMKALGVGLGAFPFVDVEVVRIGLDPPHLVLAGSALALARQAGVTRWHLSLTHTDRVAMAFVVAEGAGNEDAPRAADRPERP